MLGYQKLKKKRQTFYPYLRLGVARRPDSFIHCMERIFNDRYDGSSLKQKIAFVDEAKTKISQMHLEIAKQEMFDVSRDTIEFDLLSETQYIDPGKYISLAQLYYKCNIMLFVITEKIQESNIVIPRHSESYLLKKFNR